jgi:hypothetical protein
MTSTDSLSLPDRFISEGMPDRTFAVVRDQVTGRSCKVELKSYPGVVDALNELFGESSETTRKPVQHIVPLASEPEEVKPAKRRGRPRKVKENDISLYDAAEASTVQPEKEVALTTPKLRGRPKKVKQEEASDATTTPEVVSNSDVPNEPAEQPKVDADDLFPAEKAEAEAKAPKRRGRPPKVSPEANPAVPRSSEPLAVGNKDVIQDDGFKLLLSEDKLFYSVILDSGKNIGTITRASDNKRFDVSLEGLPTTKHSSIVGGQVRIAVSLKEQM